LAVLHAPSTKVWPPSAAEGQKITYWAQPPKNAARERCVGNLFVHYGYTLLFLFSTSVFILNFTILKLCNVKKRPVFDPTF